ncbi:MAG: Holliday junction branch migration DNA helicase RuvB, partial [Pseudomonadota bacterium]
MNEPDPTLRPEPREEDAPERALRPQSLTEFIGQRAARANLQIFA